MQLVDEKESGATAAAAVDLSSRTPDYGSYLADSGRIPRDVISPDAIFRDVISYDVIPRDVIPCGLFHVP